MSIPRIIGISGYAQHGKDTVAGVLTRELGYNRVALADEMKLALMVLNPIVSQYNFPKHPVRLATVVAMNGWEEAKKLPEVRGLLQRFGTQVGRKMWGEDHWIEQLAKNTKGFYGTERKIVIPDIRFFNEAAFVRRMGGEVWGVDRPNFDNGVGLTHESEQEIGGILADVNELFVNASTLPTFQDRIFRQVKNRMAMLSV